MGGSTEHESSDGKPKVSAPDPDHKPGKELDSTTDFESNGFQILFINDYDQVFCPVIDIDVPVCEMVSVGNEKTFEL